MDEIDKAYTLDPSRDRNALAPLFVWAALSEDEALQRELQNLPATGISTATQTWENFKVWGNRYGREDATLAQVEEIIDEFGYEVVRVVLREKGSKWEK